MSKHQILVCAALGAAACLATGSAGASPITYTAFTVTDVSLNGHHFHNASVYLKFVGDTADVTPFSAPGPNNTSGGGWQISKGTATVEIISGRRVIHAKFLPGQIVVALDQQNAGFGFTSVVGNDHHLEPAYPLGIDGTVSVDGLVDLVTPVVQTGRQWSCVGYPVAPPLGTGRCEDPATYPLHTDQGPFLIYMPYYATNAAGLITDDYEGAINNAVFTIQTP